VGEEEIGTVGVVDACSTGLDATARSRLQLRVTAAAATGPGELAATLQAALARPQRAGLTHALDPHAPALVQLDGLLHPALAPAGACRTHALGCTGCGGTG
jgi:hypothetical protein